jgi:inner membrane protein
MASLGHIAVGMAVARATGARRGTLTSLIGAMIAWSALSLLPDLDVIGRAWGVRYGDAWGHRGATHSFVFCAGLENFFASLNVPS